MKNESCVFCNIINGKIKASIVYENDLVMAIMDQRQANPGHIFVIPKIHCPNIYELTEEDGAAIMAALIPLSRAVKAAFAVEGMSIWQSNGKAGGQEVPHVHFHIHPRQMDDGLLRVYPSKPDYPSMDVLEGYARRIIDNLKL